MDAHPVAQVIKEKGGTRAVAQAMGRKVGTIRMWRNRKRLPRKYWPEINATYPDLTLKKLREIEEQAEALP